MIQKIAKAISGLSSPFLIIPLFGLWDIIVIAPTLHQFLIWEGLSFFFVAVVPLLYVLIGMRLGHIEDIHITLREQRTGPFVVATLAAFILWCIYYTLGVPHVLLQMTSALVVGGILFNIITYYWKISIHAASYVGAVLIATQIINPAVAWLLLLLPVIMWARIIRKRHDVAQSLVAAVIESIFVFLVFRFL